MRWFRPSHHRFREAVPAFLEGLQRLPSAGAAVRYTTALALVVLALALAAPMGLIFQQAPTAPLFAAILGPLTADSDV